jgi:uroporphyrinogen decarboxylase
MTEKMTSMQRVLTTLSHNEPDQVPLFLLLTMHGAKELGLTIKNYFSEAKNVVDGQLRLQKKFNNDCIYTFFYAGIETEAFGGEVIYIDDGPPNASTPFIRKFEDIKNIEVPIIETTKCLHKVLEATEKLKSEVKDDIPIIGVVMSPFSLPVMQLGFDKYIDLMYYHPVEFNKLMQINTEFCINWANAQLKSGATAICYFDPVSSTTIISKEKYMETGHQIAKHCISKINGPTATHFASGNSLTLIDEVAQTGTAVIGVSQLEDISELKSKAKNKITLLGNLNGIEMHRWTPEQAELTVKNTIEKAAPGGGFILSDNHGEIPFQVSDDTLFAISQAVQKYGKYPIGKPIE